MWSFGHSSGDCRDPERERHVRSDGARKRGARSGRTGASHRRRGSSVARRRSTTVSWPRVAIKHELEEIEHRGVVGPEDFVADVDAVAAAIAERSLREEAERRRHDEEPEALML